MYTERMRRWLLILVALLNSGGIGYWVCHQQVNSACFWFKACADDESPAVRFAQAPETIPMFAGLPCDCMFIGVDVPIPRSPSIKWSAQLWIDLPPVYLDEVPLLPVCLRAQEAECCRQISPPLLSPPTLRAPPV